MNNNKIGSHTTVVIQVLLYWYLITSIDIIVHYRYEHGYEDTMLWTKDKPMAEAIMCKCMERILTKIPGQ